MAIYYSFARKNTATNFCHLYDETTPVQQISTQVCKLFKQRPNNLTKAFSSVKFMETNKIFAIRGKEPLPVSIEKR